MDTQKSSGADEKVEAPWFGGRMPDSEETPGSNPLYMMAPLMATRCGDNKTKSL